MQHFIGIDIGATNCVAAVCNSVSASEFATFTFTNSVEGIAKFTNWLATQGCKTESSVICIETCGVYAETVCYQLKSANWNIAAEPPHKIARTAQANSAKTDKIDAQKIARYAARFLDQLHFWRPPSQTIEHITTLLTLREGYTKQSTALQNQLKSIERKYVRTSLAEKMLATDITRVKERIIEIDKELKRWIDSDDSLKKMFDAIDSVPGIGQSLAIYMIVITDCFHPGYTDKQLAAHLGIAPLDYQSGTSVYRKARSRGFGHQTIRKLLYLGAMSVAAHNKSFKDYYDRLVQAGKNKRLVINNIEYKLISYACAVVRDETVFDKNYVPVFK